MVGRNHFPEIKKDCTLKERKNDSLVLNIVPYKEKKLFFWINYSGVELAAGHRISTT